MSRISPDELLSGSRAQLEEEAAKRSQQIAYYLAVAEIAIPELYQAAIGGNMTALRAVARIQKIPKPNG